MSREPTASCDADALRLISIAAEHLDELAAIHANAFARPWTSCEIHSLAQSVGAVAVAASASDRLVGFVIARALEGEGEIVTLAVDPLSRRQGVARALVEAVIAAAHARSAEVLWLEVAVDNDPAIALYQTAGFETVGRRPRYYARGSNTRADALVMRRSLNGVLNTGRA